MNVKWYKKGGIIKKNFFSLAVFLLFMVFLIVSTNSLKNTSDKESIKSLENAINKTIVECYAIEGYYPPNIKYLEDNYGLTINKDKYIVHYEAFASNIYPDVNILVIK